MSLDTITISDLGQSLITIESEIKSNESSITYYQNNIKELEEKNKALKQLALDLVKQANPLIWRN